MDLTGKVAVVTGAGAGLGAAYAKALAHAGAAVVVNDVSAEAADTVVAQIHAEDGRASAFCAPVGSSETADALIAHAVDQFGGIDTLVTNAGILRDKVLWKMTDEDFDKVLEVHLRGTFTCVRAAVTAMRDRGTSGRIIVIGSPAGQRGNFGQTNYSGAKSGIVGMARTWAKECAKSGIDVNAVIPVAATEMTKTIPAFAPHITEYEANGTPFPDSLRKGKGFGTVDDVAGLVVYLASDAAKGISGLAVGIGGDKLSLWTQPREVGAVYTDNGWSADKIADVWDSTFSSWAEQAGAMPRQG